MAKAILKQNLLLWMCGLASVATVTSVLAEPVAPRALQVFELDDLAMNYEEGSLFDHNTSLSSSEKKAHNTAILQALDSEYFTQIPTESPTGINRRGALSESEARNLHQRLLNHPIAGPAATHARDRKGTVGFCFGRAYYVHIEALRMFRMNTDVVKKIWAIGTMEGNNITWGHHVATMVKAKEGGWWVIDSFLGMVQAKEWIRKIQNGIGRKSGDVTFYVTNANRFSPYSKRPYTKADLDDAAGYYLDFFNDLREYERRHLGEFATDRINRGQTESLPSRFTVAIWTTEFPVSLIKVNDGPLTRNRLRGEVEKYAENFFAQHGLEADVRKVDWSGDLREWTVFEVKSNTPVSAERLTSFFSDLGIRNISVKPQ